MFRYYILIIISCLSTYTFSQNSPPAIVAEGNQEFCGNAPMAIVTDVSITDSDPGDSTLDNVTVQISEGYIINEDILILSGVHPNIESSWDAQEGKLTLQGTASFVEFEDAIRSIVYETTQINFSQNKSFSINLGDGNFLPSTGHYYLYVPDGGITWENSRVSAQNLEYFGLQGYLATLTSEEESQFAGEQSPGTGWIGATDKDVEGVWKWETGPEAGLVFWNGEENGSPAGNAFSFWNTAEPNNAGNEDYAHITDPSIGISGAWNDLRNEGDTSSPSSPYYPKGYIVEFGGMPGDPEVNLSASTVIIMPNISLNTSVVCADSPSLLTAVTNTPEVLWFETAFSSTVVNTGFNYETVLTQTTTFWLLPLFDGCSGGDRIPFTVEVLEGPEALDIDIIQCDDVIIDGFTDISLSLYTEDITNGVSQNRTILFFEDVNLSSEISGALFTNTTNPQTVYAQVIDTSSGCSATAQIYIEVNSNAINAVTLESCGDVSEAGITSFDLTLVNEQITGNVPPNFSIDFYETYENAAIQVNPLPVLYTNTVPYNQTIFGRVDNQDGACFTIVEIILKVNEIPNILEDEVIFYCLNDFPQSITLNGGVINDIPNNYYYNWSTGETTMTISINEIGTYTVEVSSVNGCAKTRIIEVKPSNIGSIEAVVVADLNANNSITILVSGEGDYTFALDISNGSYQSSNIFENVSSGLHTVYVKDEKNNCGIASQEVSVIGYSKYFTPNGDGFNDFWSLNGISEQFQPTSKVQIFDRFGRLLYTLSAPSDTWDGTFNGQALPTSDYWFSAILEDGRMFNGHFTLKR